MAYDKLVDSSQLNSDLEDVADAIRAKSGGSSQLAFPSGFVSEIGNISTGGGASNEDEIIDRSISGSYTNNTVKSIGANAFNSCSRLTSVSFPEATSMGDSAFRYCSGLTSVSFPKATSIGINAFSFCSGLTSVSFPEAISIGGSAFSSCSGLTSVSFPKAISIGGSAFSSCSGLTSVSFPKATSIDSSALRYCSGLTTLVLGYTTTCVSLKNISAFSSTPFANGGTGGTIYIPETLYNHLGDGTSLDYKSATNWSTIDGYGTITWAKIEGSVYDT